MESKHAVVDKAALIHTAEGFFNAYRNRDLDKMVAHCNPDGELRYVPLGTQGEGKIGTTGRTVWSGLFDAVPDLTNRVESIFADTEGNVCAEVVLSGTLAKEFAGMMSPKRYYVLPHAFILKIYGEETRIQRIVAYWDLPKV
jgi:ketosteroid isomerase-like protein